MKRQTVSQPSIEGYQYTLLEQKGEENLYRLTARIKGDSTDTVGDLVTILGTDEEINQKIGSNVTNISPQEEFERKIDKQVNERSNKIEQKYIKYREDKPFINEMTIVESYEWNDKRHNEADEIKKFIRDNHISNLDEACSVVEKINQSLQKKGLNLKMYAGGRHLVYPKKEDRGLTITITRNQEKEKMEEYIEQQISICADKLITIFEKIEHSDNKKYRRAPYYSSDECFNVAKDEEGKEVMYKLVNHKGNEPFLASKLLGILSKKLKALGFRTSQPSPDYLVHKESNSSRWFSMERIEESLQNAA